MNQIVFVATALLAIIVSGSGAAMKVPEIDLDDPEIPATPPVSLPALRPDELIGFLHVSGSKACEDYDSNAEPKCVIGCSPGDYLFVSASSADTPPGTPTIYADADCAGVGAHCSGPRHCEGVSAHAVPQEGRGRCQASTNEPSWAKDNATVTCSSAGGSSFFVSVTMEIEAGVLVAATYRVVSEGREMIYAVPLRH